jgi:nucleotide-binding universal stress UspA family protein
MGEIVVGYDGSDWANAALDEAARLAKPLGEKVVLTFGYAPGGYGGGGVPEHRRAVEEFGEKVTKEGCERAAAAGVECDVELVNKHGADALVEVADRRGAGLIVVGSHGEGALKGAILGSTSHKLLHLAKVPVVVVPA